MSRNWLERLNSLPDNTEMLNFEGHNLKVLPDLSRFHNLKRLYCENNRLTSLPILPQTLEILFCSNNLLTSLPILPEKLGILYCENNLITSLPLLHNVYQFHFVNNPIYDIILPKSTEDNNVIKKNIAILYRFKYLYYLLKFKKRFRDLLWIKIREPKIREKYSSENLLKLLENEDLEQVLETW